MAGEHDRDSQSLRPGSPRLVWTCAVIVAGVGIVALLGWLLGFHSLASLGSPPMPVAPSTALLLIAFGAALFLRARLPGNAGARLTAVSLVGAVGLVALLVLLLFFLETRLEVEHLGFSIVHDPGEMVIGHMSVATALGFVLAALSFLAAPSSPAPGWPTRAMAAWWLASLVVAISFWFVLGYLYGTPFLYRSSLIPPAAMTSEAFMALGVALLGLAAPHATSPLEQPRFRGRGAALISIFVLLAGGIVTAGFLYDRSYQTRHRVEVEGQLSAIVEMRASELARWRAERTADASFFTDNAAFVPLVRRHLGGHGTSSTEAELRDWLSKMRKNHDYGRITLLDVGGVARLSVPQTLDPPEGHLLAQARECQESRRVVWTDFHRDLPARQIRVTIAAPILDGGRSLGAVALQVDPEKNLYPLLSRWPVPSSTAESLLVRRDGDDVLFLSPLRFRPDAALELRLPLARRGVPAVEAALGKGGIVEGLDYRGNRVVAAVRGVPASPWFLVVKMDAAEVYASFGERLWVTILLVGLLLASAAGGTAALWQRHRSQAQEELLDRERRLRESDSRLREAVRAANVGLWDWDLRTNEVFFSTEWKRQLGHEDQEIGNAFSEWQDRIHPDDRASALEVVRAFTEKRAPRYNVEFRMRHRDGSYRWILSQASVQDDALGKPIRMLGSHIDITERKQADQERARLIDEQLRQADEREHLQAQLQQAQKLESVGRLAGGVAHDFNNMLNVIMGRAEMGLRQAGAADPIRRSLEEILKAAQRSADLTRQLLAFARKQTVQPKLLDLNQTVAGMLKLLRRLIGEDLELSFLPGPALWNVRVDPSQIDQLLANLAVNARDASEGVGRISIETANAVLDAAYCAAHPDSAPGDYVVLTVADTGCGMGAETLARIFEPFFTTKEEGQGTGLGLATVYGIVKQNQGVIEVSSEPGKGSTFKVYLPRFAGEDPAKAEAAAAEAPRGGPETILLVEDEKTLLALTAETLAELGYKVLAAATPAEALSLAERHAGSIHLLLTDVVMPELNGRELAERIRSPYPGLKCLFMSGYTADVIAQSGVLDEGIRFIQKPFSAKRLADSVRSALDGD